MDREYKMPIQQGKTLAQMKILNDKCNSLLQENTQLKSELQGIRELLKSIEGRGCDIKNPHYERTHCPACGNVLTVKADMKRETAWFIGHADDCVLKAELDKIKAVE